MQSSVSWSQVCCLVLTYTCETTVAYWLNRNAATHVYLADACHITNSIWLWKKSTTFIVERKKAMMPLFSALLLWVHFAPQTALKWTLKIPFKSYGSCTCDLKANQGDISAWCNCNIMIVDKTLLFNTVIFTCHLSLSLRSVNTIDSISSKAQNTDWKKEKTNGWQTQFTLIVANISTPQCANTHACSHNY